MKEERKRVKEILFITKGGLNYGWGHIFRSLSLSDYLTKEKGCSVRMVVSGDESIKGLLDDRKIEYFFIERGDTVDKESSILKRLSYDILIADMLFLSKERQRLYASNSPLTLFFNDLGHDYSLGDIVVCPQYLYRYPKRYPGKALLNGPQYFIINKCIMRYKREKKKIKRVAKSLLIVAGGSIKKKVFDRLALLIDMLKEKGFKIRIILGYDHDFDIEDYPILHDKGVISLEGVKDIGRYIKSADLILSSCGHLKYEAAFLKAPLALFSINEHQRQLGWWFVKRGRTGVYLGDIKRDDLKAFLKKIISLTQDYNKRKAFSAQGRMVVDGRGPERIYDAMQRKIK